MPESPLITVPVEAVPKAPTAAICSRGRSRPQSGAASSAASQAGRQTAQPFYHILNLRKVPRYDLLPWIEVSFPYISPLQEISSLAQGFLRRNTLIMELVYLIFDSTYEITVRLGVLFVTLAGGLVAFLVPSHLPHRHACAGATHCSTDGADNTYN